jgi:site-specific recombinase XerD
MSQLDVFRMVRRLAHAAGVEVNMGCDTWRGTGLTFHLKNGGTLDKAQNMAGHESSRTTQLYDRRDVFDFKFTRNYHAAWPDRARAREASRKKGSRNQINRSSQACAIEQAPHLRASS